MYLLSVYRLLCQDIVSLLEDQLKPLVQAELSVLVDVLHRPELLFPTNTDARRKCESGGFISKYVTTQPHLVHLRALTLIFN